MPDLISLLPTPTGDLEHPPVTLRFSKVVPGDPARGFVPYYHFRICVNGADIGHINLRIGDTEHVRLSAGPFF